MSAMKRSSQELMDLLGMEETLNRPTKANGMRWYGHVLRRDDDMLGRALDFEANRRRGRGRPKMMRRRQVFKLVEEIGLKRNVPVTDRSGAMR